MAEQAKKSTTKPSASPSKGAAAKGTSPNAKAAKAVAENGGPENPVAGLKGFRERREAKREKDKADRPERQPITGTGKLTSSNSNRLIMTEFLICFAILGLGTIVPTPTGDKPEGVGHLAVKGSALALLFFILALIASGGEKANKAASGIGGLVTVAYLFTSQDALNIMTWIGSFYGKPKAAEQLPGPVSGQALADAGAGAVDQVAAEWAAQAAAEVQR
jgi:hypothetical protein